MRQARRNLNRLADHMPIDGVGGKKAQENHQQKQDMETDPERHHAPDNVEFQKSVFVKDDPADDRINGDNKNRDGHAAPPVSPAFF